MPNKSKISRKDALRTIGGLSLGLPIFSSLVGSASGKPDISNKGNIDGKSKAKIKNTLKKGKPNILWITTEGVPTNALGCYGSEIMPTPNIDRIAKEGMLFNNSFCTNALCAPSRATLLTGKYNHLNGMCSNHTKNLKGQIVSSFDPNQENFARIMKSNGYNTALVGKWHLPVSPGEVGFDKFIFKNGSGGPYYNAKGYRQSAAFGNPEIVDKQIEGYGTDVFTDITMDWMKDLEAKQKPFILALQYFNDHRPFDPPHKYEHIFDNKRFNEPGTFWDDYETRSSAAKKAYMRIEEMRDFNPPDDLSPRQRKQWNYQTFMRRFFATLKAQDDNIGRILDFLDKSGLADNTIVVFTGDHGIFLGDHGWFDKRFMYEQALRVPWLIRYPGVVQPGTSREEWVLSIDNAPTILDLAGISVPMGMQGKSLLPIFKGSTPADWRTSMYYHYYEFQAPHWVAPHYGIRTQKYKLIHYYTLNEWELFDLERDPDEMDNVLTMAGYKIRPGYEPIMKDLLKQLKSLRNHYKDNTGLPVKFWPVGAYN